MRHCLMLMAVLFFAACANKETPGLKAWQDCAAALNDGGHKDAAQVAREVADNYDRTCKDISGPECSDERLKSELERRKADARTAMAQVQPQPQQCSSLP